MPSSNLGGSPDDEFTIGRLLAARAADRPDARFAIFPDSQLTYGELDAAATDIAKGLKAIGVEKGTHVATLMPNCPEWLPAYFGILYAGGIVVALNARYKRHDLTYALEHSDARVLLTTDSIADFVDFTELLTSTLPGLADKTFPAPLSEPEAPKLGAIFMYGSKRHPAMGSFDDLIALGESIKDEAIAASRDAVDREDVAVILYTSGTTANPKACALSNIGIKRSWYTFSETVNLEADECVWMPMPFFHTGGIGPMTAIMSRGASFLTQPHFEPEQLVDLVKKHRVEHLYSGFPQFSLTVLQHPTYTRDNFSFVRSMLNVGPPGMQHNIQSLLPEGAKLLNLFGMTEGSGIITFTPWDSPIEKRATTSGLPPAHTELRIIDPETGGACQPDEPGEIQFRGGGAFVFYYKDDKATHDTIVDGGWVRTGDRGRIDSEGWVYYLGRLKDMLKVGGENVAAAEIEFFLNQHADVKMVQVIGVPDDRLGEVPVAFIERAPSANVTAEELIGMCDGQLAKWKIPRQILFVEEWPMSSTKVQKFRLKELLPDESVA